MNYFKQIYTSFKTSDYYNTVKEFRFERTSPNIGNVFRLHLGKITLDNEYVKATEILFNPKYKSKQTNELCTRLLGLPYRYSPTENLYPLLKSKMVMYWWRLIGTILINSGSIQ